MSPIQHKKNIMDIEKLSPKFLSIIPTILISLNYLANPSQDGSKSNIYGSVLPKPCGSQSIIFIAVATPKFMSGALLNLPEILVR
ncbi:hypothetical protein LYNGBM3L_37560 [Moorena producens 3L]|uniref:Uncharacterized protein n=1 Tax=Moorena producens 3L TaxID=489825 RepID=F4XV06_9CYAN|nr:hypothetical protein LYNGBM3L_37560 [Moorena producens 3L]